MVSPTTVTQKTRGLTAAQFTKEMKKEDFSVAFGENESRLAYQAARDNDVKTLRRLHKFGTDFDTGHFVRGVSKRPIYVAAAKGNHEAVLFLAGVGADTHADFDGHSPEAVARKNTHTKTADYLKRRK